MGQTRTLPDFRFVYRFCLALLLALPGIFGMGTLKAQPMDVFITVTEIDCYGGYGYAAVTVTGNATPPFTYLWSNGLSAQNVILVAGTWSVTVTDNNGQMASDTVTLTQPDSLGVSIITENQICGIAPDGSATAVPFGGTQPYSFLWSTGATTPQITGLAAGIYSVTVTDDKGCTAVNEAEVLFWDEGLWLMMTPTDILCYGDSTGMVEAGPMSGTAPYSYLWNTGDTTKKINNLPAGIYSVTVTDVNGCSNTMEAEVTQPDPFVLTLDITPGLGCDSLACATVQVAGGTTPYAYLWSNGATTATVCMLLPGTYYVTITDANGCPAEDSVVISSGPGLDIQVDVTSCAGCLIGGSAVVSVTNGSGNYTYLWDNGATDAMATNLTAGFHTVTITDLDLGCVDSATVNIPACTPLDVDITVNADATCSIGGKATATVSGGLPPYLIQWDNGETGMMAVNLPAGAHSVTVTDSTGCEANATFTVGQVPGPEVEITNVQQGDCLNNGNGSATATVTGGVSPFMYLWDNGDTTATSTQLAPGTHCVTVTDVNGCSDTACVVINAVNPPVPTANVVVQATCNMGASVAVTVTGGTPPYAYAWSPGGFTSGSETNVPPGTYSITVTDAGGCTGVTSVTVGPPAFPEVSIPAFTKATCASFGSATAVAFGGTPPYTFAWDNGETGPVADSLATGNHCVTVTDAGGCMDTACIYISFVPGGISIGDFVWFDDDQDGFQDPQETNGVPDIAVKLTQAGPDGIFGTADDVTISEDTTGSDGIYNFECVVPGEYVLVFKGLPFGFQFSAKDQVNNDCKDSDVNSIGRTDPFTIVQGQSDNFCFDAGIHIFCDNVTHAGTICCNQTICEGDTPALISGVQPPSGGSGPLEYMWLTLVQIGPGPPIWMGVPGAFGPTLQLGPLYETSYFMRCVRRQGCETFLESNVVTITVLPAGSPGCGPFLMDFDVKALSNHSVSIDWVALPEPMSFTYLVEHSADSITWRLLLSVPGKGNTTGMNVYHTVDQTPVMGRNYYRIRRNNSDGSWSSSEIRSVDLDMAPTEAVVVYPNPASDVLNIRNMTVYPNDVDIDVISANGDLLYNFSIPAGSMMEEKLEVKNLPSGIYLVRIRFNDGTMRTVRVSKF